MQIWYKGLKGWKDPENVMGYERKSIDSIWRSTKIREKFWSWSKNSGKVLGGD